MKRSERLLILLATLASFVQFMLSTSLGFPPDFRERERELAQKISPDGHFNGFEFYHVDHAPLSRIHCLGENYEERRSYLYRSCEYSNLCFDLDQERLVAFVDPPHSHELSDLDELRESSNQIYGNRADVLAGSQPKSWIEFNHKPKTKKKNKKPLRMAPIGRYRPEIYTDKDRRPSSYYRINATMLPFYRHPTSYRNPGHMLWDDFLPIYNLLDVFERVDDRLLLMQMVRPTVDQEGFHYFEEEQHDGHDLIVKFLPLLVGHQHSYDLKGIHLEFAKEPRWKPGEPRVVCVDYGVMGNGLFSDHGQYNWHGQFSSDYEDPHNYGRGGLFRRFRSWMMDHLGIPSTANKLPPRPYQILVSVNSSTKESRTGKQFVNLTRALKSALGTRADVLPVEYPKMNLTEQIALTSRAAMLISCTGGGASTGFFLPKGASLILFHSLQFLDWDLWNNFADVHVHWYPLEDSDTETGINILADLVRRELDRLDSMQTNKGWPSYHEEIKNLEPEPLERKQLPITVNHTAENGRSTRKDTLEKPECNSYNGILFISHVLKTAGVGTLFFQSIVDSLLYAEANGLYPWVHVNYDKNVPCYDSSFHGAGPTETISHLFGKVTDSPRGGDMHCRYGEHVGPPSFHNLTMQTIVLVGNGLWESYFEPVLPVPLLDVSCQSKPMFEMSYRQVYRGMHYCSDFAVRGWPFERLPEAVKPNGRPIHDWLWDSRSKASQIVAKYFRLKPEWLGKVQEANPNPRNCLAMHVRLTDKASGRDKKGLSRYSPYAEAFTLHMDRLGDDSPIFIATDDSKIFNAIKRSWSPSAQSRVIVQEGVKRAHGGDTPTFKLLQNDKHRSNVEALVEIYTMARCSYFVHGFSGMAEAVVYINPTLHNRSANIDDPDTVSPHEFGRMIVEAQYQDLKESKSR